MSKSRVLTTILEAKEAAGLALSLLFLLLSHLHLLSLLSAPCSLWASSVLKMLTAPIPLIRGTARGSLELSFGRGPISECDSPQTATEQPEGARESAGGACTPCSNDSGERTPFHACSRVRTQSLVLVCPYAFSHHPCREILIANYGPLRAELILLLALVWRVWLSGAIKCRERHLRYSYYSSIYSVSLAFLGVIAVKSEQNLTITKT
jgi:hypothetical protein